MQRGSMAARGRRWCAVIAAAVALLVVDGANAAGAQHATVQVSGSPATMRVSGATAGSVAAAVVESSTMYTVFSAGNNSSKKIVAQLNAPMPTGVTLMVTFEAPSTAVSIPNVALDATPRDVVTGIDFTHGFTKGITYTLSATPAAGIVPVQSRTVTLTIVGAP